MKHLFFFFTLILFSCKKNNKEDTVVFGIDISSYQGEINWDKLTSQKKHPVEFIIIRSTMGADRIDTKYKENFTKAKQNGFTVGVYHYYDPNENSKLQAENFLKNTDLIAGDFVPVLDIERISNIQSQERLLVGVKNWLQIVEKKYKRKPIIYTMLSYWKDYLKNDLSDYPLWIAAYSKEKRKHPEIQSAEIHQFADKVNIPGIKENTVDGNDIKKEVFSTLLLK